MSPLFIVAAVTAFSAWLWKHVHDGAWRVSAAVWWPSIWSFQRKDARRPWPDECVLLYGSSTFRLWKTAQADLAPRPVVNRGFGGARTCDLRFFASRVVGKPVKRGARPSVVMLYIANDITGSRWDITPHRAAELFDDTLRQIRGWLPDTPVVWIEVNPTPRRWHVWPQISQLNAAFTAVCNRYAGVHAVDLSPPMRPDGSPDPAWFGDDQLHLNEAGYEIFAERVRETLDRFAPTSQADAA